MNSESSKTSDALWLRLNFSDNTDLQREDNHLALSNYTKDFFL